MRDARSHPPHTTWESHARQLHDLLSTALLGASDASPPQPCIPEMIGRAPGETVKGGGERGGNASLPGDSRVSRRIRPLALLILKKINK
eukprot:scaffold2441_cov121-Isochrysis_galbana.AAC.9